MPTTPPSPPYRRTRWIAPLLLLAWVAGCSSLEARLDTYLAEGAPVVALERVALVPNAEAENPLLDAELLRHLASLLAERGIEAVEPTDATLGMLASTSLSDPTSTFAPTPVWQPGGAYFAQTTGPGGATFTPVTAFGGTYAQGSSVRYTHRLSLMLFELAAYRATGELKPVWIGEARYFGRSSDLRTISRSLAVALVEYLGRDTGREVSVRIDP